MAHHGVSGLVGKLATQLEVNCDADEFYKIWKHHEEIPQAVFHLFPAVKVVQGDGLVSGCIKDWDYILEGKAMRAKEQTTHNDEARTLHHHVCEGDLLKDYKKFDDIIEVNPKPNGHGCIVTWSGLGISFLWSNLDVEYLLILGDCVLIVCCYGLTLER
ncbi:major latex protein 146-like [Papaver somniferum]|uniref:major latex protein 146-like n=1 Tax=Papaver somniferum TaxID=3469 RepID=UPI000E6FCE4C|nr:major latex protein 146-like [Papaver somniferum]